MQLDSVLTNMGDFEYICPESITWVDNNILGQGYTVTTVIERMNIDPLIPDHERRVWIRNARRMFQEPAAIYMGGDTVETDVFRLLVNTAAVTEGSLAHCQGYIWLKYSKVSEAGAITVGTPDNFTVIETVMGQSYTDDSHVASLVPAIERKVEDTVDGSDYWKPYTP